MRREPPSGEPQHWSVIAVIAATTLAQVAAAMGSAVFPIIAPKLAPVLGVPPAFVGYQQSLIYGIATIGTCFLGGMITRYGACRTMQASLALCVTAMLLTATASQAAVVAASVLLGIGMSVMNPATAHLLYRFSPATSRNLIFSIKQTGVPFAWLLLALIAPGIALAWGWRWALAPVLAMALVMLILLQTVRAAWDDDRSTHLAAGYSYLAGMRVLWQPPALRWLAIASFCYSFLQLCLGSFLVTMMVEEAAYSLVEAGLLLSLTQAAGVAGRIFWGWCADRLGNGLVILQRLNVVMIACCIAAAFITPRWPAAALIALFAAFGASAVGWNGIFLAEVARRSPHGMISVAVGGAMMWNFGGILAGPATFATLYQATGSYTATFGWLTIVATTGLALISAARRAAR